MVEIPRLLFLLICVFGQLFGLFLFLKGFFPITAAVPGRATFYNLPVEPLFENGSAEVFNLFTQSPEERHQQQSSGKVGSMLQWATHPL